MPTACINQSHCRVQLVGERLEVHGTHPETGQETCLREIPLRDLDRLILSDTVHFTTPALCEILSRSIPIQLFTWQGKFLGQFLPAENHHGHSRLVQYQRTLEPNFALTISAQILTAKLYNQRRVLQRLAANRGATALSLAEPHLRWLENFFHTIRHSTTLDEMRGHEGVSTARYFQTWATFLPAEFPFERRSSRPPLNPVNACISFGATLLYNEMTAALHTAGLDPALGLLHSTENGRWSLALDLLEPFRPILVEALALDLFSHQILNTTHFESRNSGILLNEAGRKKFFLQYERRMERQFLSESLGHRTTLRQQLEATALLYKAALHTPESFQPFLMN